MGVPHGETQEGWGLNVHLAGFLCLQGAVEPLIFLTSGVVRACLDMFAQAVLGANKGEISQSRRCLSAFALVKSRVPVSCKSAFLGT